MALTLQQSLIFKDNILVQEMGGEKVLLHLGSEQYFGLDEIGATIWDTLKTVGSLQAGYEQLLTMYDVESSQLLEDLLSLVEKWIEHGLVEVAE